MLEKGQGPGDTKKIAHALTEILIQVMQLVDFRNIKINTGKDKMLG